MAGVGIALPVAGEEDIAAEVVPCRTAVAKVVCREHAAISVATPTYKARVVRTAEPRTMPDLTEARLTVEDHTVVVPARTEALKGPTEAVTANGFCRLVKDPD